MTALRGFADGYSAHLQILVPWFRLRYRIAFIASPTAKDMASKPIGMNKR